MRLNPLKIFLAIVDTGSQHGAARALGLTQPAVTKALQRLEAELDVRLFDRSVHGAELTEYGQALLLHARLVDAELKAGVDTLNHIKGERRGSVAVALAHMPATVLMPRILPVFRRAWPDVQLRIAASVYPFLLPQVREGALDFAISPAPSKNWPEDLVRVPLLATRLTPVVRVGHPLAGAVALAELVEAEWLLPTQECATAQALRAAMQDANLPRPACMVTCETFTGLLTNVAASDMVGLIPKEMVHSIAAAIGVVEIPIAEQMRGADLCLIRRRASVLPPAAAALADRLERAAKAMPGGLSGAPENRVAAATAS